MTLTNIARFWHLAVVLIGFSVSAPLQAQSSWEELRSTLHAGDQIKVRDDAGQEQKGAFTALSNEAVSLQAHRGAVSIERARVRRIEVRSNSRQLRNALIGTAVGVAIAVIADQTIGKFLRNEGNDSSRALIYIAPIGVIGGISAALPAYRTVYRVR